MRRICYLLVLLLSLVPVRAFSQELSIHGKVVAEGKPLAFAQIYLKEENRYILTDSLGFFSFSKLTKNKYTVLISHIGYIAYKATIATSSNAVDTLNILLEPSSGYLNEIVVTGTMKEVMKSASPVPIEIYHSKFFKTNPSCSVFDALQNINGVRPQLNCNICNTGDIHINGLEGPYTMILIDGMPIVSGLSTIYGLAGIPQSLIDRVEIVKGPASTLYGSEAVGGLVNIITKKIELAPVFSVDVFNTTWNELNTDLSSKLRLTKKVQTYFGINLFNYTNPLDKNKDNFTDVTIQRRFSIFNKWDFNQRKKGVFTVAGRYVMEDRWGGEMNWNRRFRGGDSIYAENIITNRWELLSNYSLPTKEKIVFKSSVNYHYQNSVYGQLFFLAKQFVGFGQLTWEKKIKEHELLLGTSVRYTYYDDNTVVTSNEAVNNPSKTNLPGAFIQDEIRFNQNNTLLGGIRYDYNSIHGNIVSPRINYKWNSFDQQSILRIGIGNGYRVANIYSEDHAALTGSRKVQFLADIHPETSWNAHLNFQKRWVLQNNSQVGIDATAFYTYFSNKIIADYLTDPNKIIYDNLKGYAISRGLTLNIDYNYNNHLKLILGSTFLDVFSMKEQQKIRQLFTEKFTSTWTISYTWVQKNIVVDYTGNLYSPMKLPLLGPLDPRREFSPWWSIQNIQITKKSNKDIELYAGVKNLLNWTPNKGNPFIIARANDPFDKNVLFDQLGQALPTSDNQYGLTFDPSYVYGPNQGIKLFLGIRYTIK